MKNPDLKVKDGLMRLSISKSPFAFLGVVLLLLECIFAMPVMKTEGWTRALFIAVMVVSFASYAGLLASIAFLRPRALYGPCRLLPDGSTFSETAIAPNYDGVDKLLREHKHLILAVNELKAKRGEVLEALLAGSEILHDTDQAKILNTLEALTKELENQETPATEGNLGTVIN